MRRIVAHQIVTLDGVAAFDAVVDTISELRDTEVLDRYFARVADEEAMLLGRVTYQEWAEYWPTSTFEPFASHINRVPKYVVTSTLATVPWGSFENANVAAGSLADEVAALVAEPGRNIGVHGSPTLVAGLLSAGLLDELHLEIYPVVAGTGKRLFNEGQLSSRLRLIDSHITSTGVALLSYEPSNGPGSLRHG